MRRRATIGILSALMLGLTGAMPARSQARSEWRPNIDLHEVAERVGMDWVLVSLPPAEVARQAVAAEYERFAAWRAFGHCLSDMRHPRPRSEDERIAFASDRDGDFEIYVMDTDGSNVIQVTDNGFDDVRPDWAPDGRRLAFSRGKHIHIVDVDTRKECLLGFKGDPVKGTHAAWSPDGKWIAYSFGDCEGSGVIADRSRSCATRPSTTTDVCSLCETASAVRCPLRMAAGSCSMLLMVVGSTMTCRTQTPTCLSSWAAGGTR